MADFLINIRDLSRRLWLSGGRDTIPPNAMRRCVGAAPDPEPVVKSRWGSISRFFIRNVLAIASPLTTAHILSDGVNLYADSAIIDTGYNGGRPTFVKAPVSLSSPNYIFVAGGGKLTKIDPQNNVTQWGITPPSNAMNAAILGLDSTVIDDFRSNPAATWTPVNCGLANETASVKITPNNAGSWSLSRTFSPVLNLESYSNNTISLPSDVIHFIANFENPADIVWLQINIDVNLGDFATDYYTATISVVGPTSDVNVVNPVISIIAAPFQYNHFQIPKSSFTRMGSNLNFDWKHVVAIQFIGGNLIDFPPAVHIGDLELSGGAALGAGPWAVSGGAEFQYLVTFGNTITGNDSNPNGTPSKIFNVALEPVNLTNIPISTDPQVSNRKLWRTTEDGALFFYLDVINDNTTTTYIDRVSSTPGQPIITTPWVANVNAPTSSYIDGGNGYFFKTTPGGTTGNTLPVWNIPTAQWVARGVFQAGDIILPALGYKFQLPPNAFQCIVGGITSTVEPNWQGIGLNHQVTDNQVTWQNIGTLNTIDNTTIWQCTGINAVPTLGTEQVSYDNTVFPSTIGDALSFQGSMFATRDAATGAQNNIYISTPGKPEGYANIIIAGSEDDPCQKLITWDEQLYVMTTRYLYPIIGTPPNMAAQDLVVGAEGTSWPFTVVQSPWGIVYRAAPGIKLFNNAVNEFLGYEAISPIENGQTVENVPLLQPTIAAHCRSEIFFSDGVTTFAYSMVSKTWRLLGKGAIALTYHDEEDLIHFAYPDRVVDWESFGALNDDGAPIAIEWQSPSVMQDATQVTMSKRLWFDIDCAGQTLTPTLLVNENEITLPVITNGARSRIVIPYQTGARLFGVRITGNVLARVTFYGFWAEGRIGR